MYEMRPIITFDNPIELPDCMYNMKNIHAAAEQESSGRHVGKAEQIPTNSGTFKQNIQNKEMAELELRQENLLSQLEELKKIMQNIKANLKISNKNPSKPADCAGQKQELKISLKLEEIPSDIVINVNPNYPPYFLLFLQRLLKDQLTLNIDAHLHSSVQNLNGKSKDFVEKLNSFQTNGAPSVNLRLIWKEIGPNPELNVSYSKIQGEANILRYLVRVIDNNLNYEKNSNPEKIDSLLDLSYRLSCSNSSSKSRNSLIQFLNKSLSGGNSKWLAGQNNITIADVAVYNSVKNVCNSSEITGSLSKWFNQCEQFVK